jgi:hypothetical protein
MLSRSLARWHPSASTHASCHGSNQLHQRLYAFRAGDASAARVTGCYGPPSDCGGRVPSRLTSGPPAARRDRRGTSTRSAVRSPAEPCGPCVCRQERVTIATGRARAAPSTLRDCPPQPSLKNVARARRLMCVPPRARRDRGGTSTRCAVRASRSPGSAVASGGRVRQPMSRAAAMLTRRLRRFARHWYYPTLRVRPGCVPA